MESSGSKGLSMSLSEVGPLFRCGLRWFLNVFVSPFEQPIVKGICVEPTVGP